MNIPHGLVDRISRSRVKRPPDDLAVVGNTDQNDPAIRIGERDHGLLQRCSPDAFLELDVLALLGEFLPEFPDPKGEREILSLGVKWRIWGIS